MVYRVVASKYQCPTIAHFNMIKAARDDCTKDDKLIIAITNPDPKKALALISKGKMQDVDKNLLNHTAKERVASENDPLTYWERVCLLKTGLDEMQISEYCIVPFFLPEVYSEEYVRLFLPPFVDSIFYLTDKEEWEKTKAHYYEERGAKVTVIPAFKDKSDVPYSGKALREAIRNNKQWEYLTLTSVAKEMKKLGLVERIRNAK